MFDIIIVGGGGFAREVFQWTNDWLHSQPTNIRAEYQIKGFLSRSLDDLEGYSMAVPILGTDDDYIIMPNDRFVVALGDVTVKKNAVRRLHARGAKFHTVIHPTSLIAHQAKVGEGVIICPFAAALPFSTISDFAMLNIYSSVGHDAQVGQFSVLSPYATLNGGAVLEDEVFLGSHTTVTAGKRVYSGAKVSANSVVMSDVPSNSLVLGNPGRHFFLPKPQK